VLATRPGPAYFNRFAWFSSSMTSSLLVRRLSRRGDEVERGGFPD
jgi:hypothetical protein